MDMVSWESSQTSSMTSVLRAKEEADKVVKFDKDILSLTIKANSV